MDKKNIFLAALLICGLINLNTVGNISSINDQNNHNHNDLKKKLERLQKDKSSAEIWLSDFKEYSSLSGYVEREVKPWYTSFLSKGGDYSQPLNVLVMPFEAVRIIVAYPCAPITIPLFATLGTAAWINDKEKNELELEKRACNLQAVEAEIRITQEQINLLTCK